MKIEVRKDIILMSDLKWDLYCLVDRIFHPEKYCEHENVEKVIRKITDRWKSKCNTKSERKAVTLFVNEVRHLPDCDRAEAEKSIIEQIRKKYK